MVLLSLPYPPLPVIASRMEDGTDDDSRLVDGVTTTHTLIAKGLTESMARDDATANASRRIRQTEVFQRFLSVMAAEGFHTTDPARLYEIYCRFSMDYIATYLPPGHPVDFRVPPLSYIVKRDRTHTRLAEYMAAQSIFFGDEPPVPRDHYLSRSPGDLLFDLRARLGHVMTQEERARAAAIESLAEQAAAAT